jgi:hypothetical protein
MERIPNGRYTQEFREEGGQFPHKDSFIVRV